MNKTVFPRTGARGLPQQFPRRLYDMLESESQGTGDKLIQWTESGLAFEIVDVTLFSALVLPKYYKTNRFSSFQRNLNLYGFKKPKCGPDQDCYLHPAFKRGRPDLLSMIQKLKTTTKNAMMKEQKQKKIIEEFDAQNAAAIISNMSTIHKANENMKKSSAPSTSDNTGSSIGAEKHSFDYNDRRTLAKSPAQEVLAVKNTNLATAEVHLQEPTTQNQVITLQVPVNNITSPRSIGRKVEQAIRASQQSQQEADHRDIQEQKWQKNPMALLKEDHERELKQELKQKEMQQAKKFHEILFSKSNEISSSSVEKVHEFLFSKRNEISSSSVAASLPEEQTLSNNANKTNSLETKNEHANGSSSATSVPPVPKKEYPHPSKEHIPHHGHYHAGHYYYHKEHMHYHAPPHPHAYTHYPYPHGPTPHYHPHPVPAPVYSSHGPPPPGPPPPAYYSSYPAPPHPYYAHAPPVYPPPPPSHKLHAGPSRGFAPPHAPPPPAQERKPEDGELYILPRNPYNEKRRYNHQGGYGPTDLFRRIGIYQNQEKTEKSTSGSPSASHVNDMNTTNGSPSEQVSLEQSNNAEQKTFKPPSSHSNVSKHVQKEQVKRKALKDKFEENVSQNAMDVNNKKSVPRSNSMDFLSSVVGDSLDDM